MQTSPFLRLPVEIHLEIFQYCTLSGPITIASRPATESDRGESCIPGLTPGNVPATALGFDQALLESSAQSYARSQDRETESRPTDTSSDDGYAYFRKQDIKGDGKVSVRVPDAHLHPTLPSLHLVCRQIHEELLADSALDKAYLSHPRNLDLYLSYPDGVCIAQHRYPHLLRVARSINIAGVCDLTSIEDPRRVRLADRQKDGHEEEEEKQKQISILTSKSPITPTIATGLESGVSALESAQVNALEVMVNNVLGKRAMLAAEKAQEEEEALAAYTGSDIASTTGSRTPSDFASSTESSASISPASTPADELDRPALVLPTIAPPPAKNGNNELFPALYSKPAPLVPSLTIRMFHPNPSERPAPAPFVRSAEKADSVEVTVEPSSSASSSPARYTPPSPSFITTTTTTTTVHATPILRTNLSPRSPTTTLTPSALAMSQDPYSLLWSHTLSPATSALPCIHSGEIKLSVSRGRKGNGIEIHAAGNVGQGRSVSCHWPRLNLKESDHAGLGWLVPSHWGLDPEVEERKAMLAWWEDLKSMGYC